MWSILYSLSFATDGQSRFAVPLLRPLVLFGLGKEAFCITMVLGN